MVEHMLLKTFLEFPTHIKLYHWRTKSYSRHKASDELHEKMQDLIDKFIEILQGKLGMRVSLNTDNLTIHMLNDDSAEEYLKDFKKFLMIDLEDILEKTNMRNTDLLNIRDEMMGVVNQTLYLFSLV
jgi:hypothetical protein